MSWISLTFDHTRIQGHALTAFLDRDGEIYDQTMLTAALQSTAKLNIRRLMLARMATTAAQAASITAFFDAMAADTDLADLVQDLWAVEALKLWFRQQRFADGDWLDLMLQEAKDMADDILKALEDLAGVILGLTESVATAPAMVVSARVMDIWDLDDSTEE